MADNIPPIMIKDKEETTNIQNTSLQLFDDNKFLSELSSIKDLIKSNNNGFDLTSMSADFTDLYVSLDDGFLNMNNQLVEANNNLVDLKNLTSTESNNNGFDLTSMSADFTDLYVSLNDGFLNMNSQLIEANNNLDDLKNLTSTEINNNGFEEYIARRRLEYEKDVLEAQKEEALAKYEKQKNMELPLFEKMTKGFNEFLASNKGSETKAYMQSLLGPLNIIFDPMKKVLKDLDLIKKKKETDKEKIELEKQLNAENEIKLRAIENEYLDKFSNTIVDALQSPQNDESIMYLKSINDKFDFILNVRDVTPVSNAPLQITDDSEDNPSRELLVLNDTANKELMIIDDELKENNKVNEDIYNINETALDNQKNSHKETLDVFNKIDGSIDETTKETKKNRPKADNFLSMIMGALPLLIGGVLAGSGIDFKGAIRDIFGGIWDMTIGKWIEDFKTWGENLIDKLTPEFLKNRDQKKLDSTEDKLGKIQGMYDKEKEQIENKELSEGGAFGIGRYTEEDRVKDLAKLKATYLQDFKSLSKAANENRKKLKLEGKDYDFEVEDAIIQKDGQVIKASPDDNIFATKNDLSTIGFDNRDVSSQSKEVVPDMSLDIRDLLIKNNNLLEMLNKTLSDKQFSANVNVGQQKETKTSPNLSSLRNIGD